LVVAFEFDWEPVLVLAAFAFILAVYPNVRKANVFFVNMLLVEVVPLTVFIAHHEVTNEVEALPAISVFEALLVLVVQMGSEPELGVDFVNISLGAHWNGKRASVHLNLCLYVFCAVEINGYDFEACVDHGSVP
jgi:hypothetical protein